MVHQDFRLIAVRQVANDILILFLYLCTLRPTRLVMTAQAALWLLSSMVFPQSLLNLALIATAAAAWEPETRRVRLVACAGMAAASLACVAGYFALFPDGLAQVVIDQLAWPPVGSLERVRDVEHAAQQSGALSVLPQRRVAVSQAQSAHIADRPTRSLTLLPSLEHAFIQHDQQRRLPDAVLQEPGSSAVGALLLGWLRS